jgi:hypothetical protein
MVAEKDLVFVSYYAAKGRAVKKSCEAIWTQLQPFTRMDTRFKLWHRSSISAGSNKDKEIEASLRRCKIAVLLVCSEYLASEHWDREAKPLLAAAQKGDIHLLWQQVAACNCNQEAIHDFQQIIPETVLTHCRPAVREQYEQKISEVVFKAWKEFPLLSQRLYSLPIDCQEQNLTLPMPLRRRCDAVGLVLAPSGQETPEVHYAWRAFIQRAGEEQFQLIPNGAIGGRPSYVKNSLPVLLECLRYWIASELKDEPVLEIFAPRDLLNEDWGNIGIQAGKKMPLNTCQPFLLRSSDRLLNPWLNNRVGALRRMHHHLVMGTGAWLVPERLAKMETLETLESLDGESLDESANNSVITAICLLPSAISKHKSTWIESVQASMAPLVVWPSRSSALGEEQLLECLRCLHLIREDGSKDSDDSCKDDMLKRPYCPDLAHFAKARQNLARSANERKEMSQSAIDSVGLTILVDHPDRAPDRKMLQALFPSSGQDPASAPAGDPLASQSALLISS